VAIRLDQAVAGEYSQHGEHGVIDAVFGAIGIRSRTCVEFGAYDLRRLSNVYPLWTTGWRALLIEGDDGRYAQLVADYRDHPQHAEGRVEIDHRFVAESGANSLDRILAEHGFPDDPDLVCIDVDGLDLQVWRGLQRVRPRLAVVEYNPTIPPHIDLVGGEGVGSSASALARLGREKGYSLVACIGWNGFFVEREHASLFEDADDLEALFDPSYLRHAMQTYGGEVFFSSPLHLGWVPLYGRDTEAIESSSNELGLVRWTVPGVVEATGRRALKPLKRRFLHWQGKRRLRREERRGAHLSGRRTPASAGGWVSGTSAGAAWARARGGRYGARRGSGGRPSDHGASGRGART
jgi:hypothetical protein